jgi:hypothetical protein
MTDLYGFASGSLHDAARSLELALGIVLRLRASSYRCGEYYLCRGEGEELILQENCQEVEGELVEPEFPDKKVLLYVSSNRYLEIEQKLLSMMNEAGVALLRRKILDKPINR